MNRVAILSDYLSKVMNKIEGLSYMMVQKIKFTIINFTIENNEASNTVKR